MMLAKSRLHGMQLAAIGEAFDGGHIAAVALHRQGRAGFDRLAVDMHDASPTLAGVATDMRARQAKMLTQ